MRSNSASYCSYIVIFRDGSLLQSYFFSHFSPYHSLTQFTLSSRDFWFLTLPYSLLFFFFLLSLHWCSAAIVLACLRLRITFPGLVSVLHMRMWPNWFCIPSLVFNMASVFISHRDGPIQLRSTLVCGSGLASQVVWSHEHYIILLYLSEMERYIETFLPPYTSSLRAVL